LEGQKKKKKKKGMLHDQKLEDWAIGGQSQGFQAAGHAHH